MTSILVGLVNSIRQFLVKLYFELKAHYIVQVQQNTDKPVKTDNSVGEVTSGEESGYLRKLIGDTPRSI